MQHVLTKEQVKTLKKLYFKEHLSQREIARRLGVDRRSIARWLQRDTNDRTPHRASPVNKSPGKLFLPFVTEQIAQRGSQRGLTAALYRELSQQDPPFLGFDPISERTLERVVNLAIVQMAQQKREARRARCAATRRAKAEALAQAQAQAQEQAQAQAQEQAQAQAQEQAQAQAQEQEQTKPQEQSDLEPSMPHEEAPRHHASRLHRRQVSRHVCYQRMSLKPTSEH